MHKRFLFFFWFFLILALLLRLINFFQTSRLIPGREVSFSALLLEEPKIYSRFQRFSLGTNTGEKVYITLPLESEYSYGDSLKVQGVVKQTELESAATIWTMQNPQILASPRLVGVGYFLHGTGFVRSRFIEIFSYALPKREAGLLLGIVFGIKDQIPSEYKKQLQTAGVYHVVAASGMNVTLLAGVVIEICAFVLRRQVALLLSIIIIFSYAAISGFDPPIVRAGCMASAAFLAQLFGRQYSGYYVLLLTGTLMLLWSPAQLFSVGFQLSFLATAGMLFLEVPKGTKETKGPKGKILDSVKMDFKTSVAATLATLPILLGFGNFSIWGILANVLVLWTIAPLLFIGAMGAIVGIFFVPAGIVIIWLSMPLLTYFNLVVMYVSSLPGVISVHNIHWSFIVGYYSFIIAGVLIWKRNK